MLRGMFIESIKLGVHLVQGACGPRSLGQPDCSTDVVGCCGERTGVSLFSSPRQSARLRQAARQIYPAL